MSRCRVRHVRKNLIAACLIVASLTACGQEPATSRVPPPPAVSIGDAELTGLWQQDGRVAAFLGIPFAEPPVGERRWQPPRALEELPSLAATGFAPACMQTAYMVDWYAELIRDFGGDPARFPVPDFSEDCLYLNVWTPAADSGQAMPAMPVMVWIHGGGHRGGWSFEPNYLGDALASGGVVVVSIAYRLDVFGFFSHPDLAQSNFGLLDQIAALEWIQAHIHRFGGDPENVTLFGESAGAASAGYLMVSPAAEGLFDRVIHQSAGYEFINEDRRADFLALGEALEAKVQPASEESGIDALRDAPAERLLSAAADVFSDYQPDAVVDGHTLTEPPAESLAAGRVRPVDLMIGSNADEWKMYLEADVGAVDLEAWFSEHLSGRAGRVLEVLEPESGFRRRLDRLTTARQFVCPSLDLAEAVTRAGGDAYLYYFSRVRSGALAGELGAYHGAEIPYVFDKHDDWLPTDDTDRRLGRTMADYWRRFARTGDPNGEGRVIWPPIDAARLPTIEFGDEILVKRHPEAELCAVLTATAADAE